MSLGLSVAYCCVAHGSGVPVCPQHANVGTQNQYNFSTIEYSGICHIQQSLACSLVPVNNTVIYHITNTVYNMDLSEAGLQRNLENMRNGQLYYAFTPDLIAARARCSRNCRRFNEAVDVSRRRQLELWKE